MKMNQNWNAEKYSSDFSFVHEYGNDVISLIDLKNARSVLDLGCGNGALSKVLAEKGLIVTGMDASEDMLAVARKNCPGIRFHRADATDFTLEESVDAVFSNAVFHWIDKSRQEDMMHCVYQALNDGGQFVFEMGGTGNNRLIHTALAQEFTKLGYTYTMPFYFPSIGEYAAMLEKTGFTVRYAVLFDRPTRLNGADGLTDWIKMFVKNPFVNVTEDDRQVILKKAVSALAPALYKDGVWYSDYVRLRMKAVKENTGNSILV